MFKIFKINKYKTFGKSEEKKQSSKYNSFNNSDEKISDDNILRISHNIYLSKVNFIEPDYLKEINITNIINLSEYKTDIYDINELHYFHINVTKETCINKFNYTEFEKLMTRSTINKLILISDSQTVALIFLSLYYLKQKLKIVDIYKLLDFKNKDVDFYTIEFLLEKEYEIYKKNSMKPEQMFLPRLKKILPHLSDKVILKQIKKSNYLIDNAIITLTSKQ